MQKLRNCSEPFLDSDYEMSVLYSQKKLQLLSITVTALKMGHGTKTSATPAAT